MVSGHFYCWVAGSFKLNKFLSLAPDHFGGGPSHGDNTSCIKSSQSERYIFSFERGQTHGRQTNPNYAFIFITLTPLSRGFVIIMEAATNDLGSAQTDDNVEPHSTSPGTICDLLKQSRCDGAREYK